MTDTAKRRVQFNLLSIMLLISACAVWIAYRSVCLETHQIELQLPGLREIARELVVKDPNEFAVVTRLPTMYGELIWDLHVPDLQDQTAMIAVVMDEVSDNRSFDPRTFTPLKSALLAPGKRKVQLLYKVGETAKLTVMVDDEPAIEIERAKDWIVTNGHSSSSDVSGISSSYPVDKAITLHRRQFSLRDAANNRANEPGPGIWLWIETKSK